MKMGIFQNGVGCGDREEGGGHPCSSASQPPMSNMVASNRNVQRLYTQYDQYNMQLSFQFVSDISNICKYLRMSFLIHDVFNLSTSFTIAAPCSDDKWSPFISFNFRDSGHMLRCTVTCQRMGTLHDGDFGSLQEWVRHIIL